MTEDQVRELAEVSANVRHVMKTVDAMMQRIDNLLTRPEHEAALRVVNDRVKALEDRFSQHVESVSTRSTMAKLRDVLLTVAAAGAACGVVLAFFKFLFQAGA